MTASKKERDPAGPGLLERLSIGASERRDEAEGKVHPMDTSFNLLIYHTPELLARQLIKACFIFFECHKWLYLLRSHC